MLYFLALASDGEELLRDPKVLLRFTEDRPELRWSYDLREGLLFLENGLTRF